MAHLTCKHDVPVSTSKDREMYLYYVPRGRDGGGGSGCDIGGGGGGGGAVNIDNLVNEVRSVTRLMLDFCSAVSN